MSAIVTATYEGQSFQVEIAGDGNLVFLDYDVDYDLAMIEFGEPFTVAAVLVERWRKNPPEIICKNFGLDKKTLVLLSADWVEHVLPIYESSYKEDKKPSDIINAARGYIKKEIPAVDLYKLRTAIELSITRAWKELKAGEAEVAQAATLVATAAWAEERTTTEAAASKVAETAAEAAADGAAYWTALAYGIETFLPHEARQKEISWQIRRFVEVMEALQTGRPWPPLGATQ